MVHPYLRRRNGEAPEYPNEEIKQVLGRTLGVPLFQEQAMRLVMVAAGFTAGEADQLRRAMAAWKRKGHLIERFTGKILSGMAANGYTRAFAMRVVDQIKGFADYGFPESHAASFALLVYVSAWLKCHHPAAFAAALINSQPMGFYQPAQIVRDAREHGVEILPVDVNASGWDCSLEAGMKETRNQGNKEVRKQGNEGIRGKDESQSLISSFPHFLDSSAPALRLGMRLVTQMREVEAEAIAEAVRRQGRFDSVEALWRASGVRVSAMRALARADAFGSMGLDRQRALWEVMKLRDEALPLFDGREETRKQGNEEMREGICSLASSFPGFLHSSIPLPPIPASTQVVYDYAATGLSLKAHPVSFARGALARSGVSEAGAIADERLFPHGKKVAVAGLVLVRQRPGTAAGIVFVTLEDETGVTNLVVRPNIYEQYRRALRHSVALVAWGKVERQGQVVHVLVERAANLTEVISRRDQRAPRMESASRDFH
jgi:error-prone DNA polymerase